jgi:putative transposase
MHLTLKRECTRPPQRTRAQPQHRFDRWRQESNTLRPHEALADATPASVYPSSARPYPARLPPLGYPGHYQVRRVSRNGGIRWHKPWVNVRQTLGEEDIGLVEIDAGTSTSARPAWADSMSALSSSRTRSAGTTAGVIKNSHLCLRT